MEYSNLLLWWIISISWCAVFLIVVSFLLYATRGRKTAEGAGSLRVRPTDFVFVIVLGGLLGLYIVSIAQNSSLIFAAGNIVVEVVLVAYTWLSWKKTS